MKHVYNLRAVFTLATYTLLSVSISSTDLFANPRAYDLVPLSAQLCATIKDDVVTKFNARTGTVAQTDCYVSGGANYLRFTAVNPSEFSPQHPITAVTTSTFIVNVPVETLHPRVVYQLEDDGTVVPVETRIKLTHIATYTEPVAPSHCDEVVSQILVGSSKYRSDFGGYSDPIAGYCFTDYDGATKVKWFFVQLP